VKIDIQLTPSEVLQETLTSLTDLYGAFPSDFIGQLFTDVEQLFTASWKEYQRIDSGYHDLEHTLRATQCLVRLLVSCQRETGNIPVDKCMIGITAMLLHDMGFLKEAGDVAGAGGQYTLAHQTRSCQFAHKYLHEKDWLSVDVLSVETLIHCTALNTHLNKISFLDSVDEILGKAIATANVLGQMSDPAYIKKLYFLYEELREADTFRGVEDKQRLYQSPEALIGKTPGFWIHVRRDKLDNDYDALYKYLADPYPNGNNPYIQAIEANMQRIRALVGV